jgi:hypothetical protein
VWRSMSDDPAATLLLLLRLTAFAPDERIASRLGWTGDEVVRRTAQAQEAGWIRHRDGMAAGWSLTPEGRRFGAERLRAEVDTAGTGSQLEACYQGFLPLNSELLAVCTDWQTVDIAGELVPNDHTDVERDAAVLERLAVLHRRARPVLDALGDALDRFDGYVPRLDRAHGHIVAGRTEWIAKPTVDSYHGIWFELHEHLLVTLGRERSTEPLPEYVPTLNGDTT